MPHEIDGTAIVPNFCLKSHAKNKNKKKKKTGENPNMQKALIKV